MSEKSPTYAELAEAFRSPPKDTTPRTTTWVLSDGKGTLHVVRHCDAPAFLEQAVAQARRDATMSIFQAFGIPRDELFPEASQ